MCLVTNAQKRNGKGTERKYLRKDIECRVDRDTTATATARVRYTETEVAQIYYYYYYPSLKLKN